jgi:large subunit ribosomal protein L25
MADQRPALEVVERPERGSRATRRLRRDGFVPGVVYGGGDGDSRSFKVGGRDLRHALAGGSAVLDLKVDGGKAEPVIVKDEQRDPVRGELVHIDLLRVRLDEKIQSTVALDIVNTEESPGAKEGGVVEHVTRELNIEALPTNLPERIVVDVSHLEAAQTMTLAEVPAPEGVEFLDDPEETVIATVTVPTEVAEPEIEEETELVGEEGEEAAEAEAEAEGATGEEAEAASGDEGGEES